MIFLSGKWARLFMRIGAKGDWQESYKELTQKLSEPQRVYTNKDYVRSCFEQAELANPQQVTLDSLNALELFIFLHKSICDPSRNDNIKKSSDFAYDFLGKMKVDEKLAEKTCKLITGDYQKMDVVDLFLARDILSSPWGVPYQVFVSNQEKFRQEHAFLTRPEFNQWISEVYQKMLGEDLIYLTPQFKNKYESITRKNLQKFVRELKKE
ncbi:hypothetical protein J4474_01285 [Candidatus Pacearchaeota archaeon]|nr:hypothetical protein [Candidatus Pacearchaeota archaeon]